ncbi:PD40 domain-containing protein [Microbacterium yannicii]|uniref:PD40 domain-containing protein n=1 Tax=Microbacterium yannicii TaxID=671622 RepID=A0ABP9LUP6_9MICO|nr:PD40 domain-containing protein [Microbacterium yannicii]MCO5952338.1 PD40 domain-containing protein [Microbacterium yannicii]
MTARLRWTIIIAISVIAVGATIAMGVFAWAQYQARLAAPSDVDTISPSGWAEGDRIVFRNTATGQGYGLVSSVPLGDPAGARAVTSTACDRVAAIEDEFSCLRSERGITPTYTATLYDNNESQLQQWPLPGIPSRTRYSPDGTLVATTSFVTGHTYATIGFSTGTTIHRAADGSDVSGNLEEWTLYVDGEVSAPVDRNYWGITFIDDTTFYATVGMTTAGATYLVKGDIPSKTMRTVAESVECPSLSPDGTRIAFKRVTRGSGATVHWTPAVMDVASGDFRVLDAETRSVDDQIAWLDDATLLYGLTNATVGDSDVWSLAADGSGEPELFIPHAWSPSAVRG